MRKIFFLSDRSESRANASIIEQLNVAPLTLSDAHIQSLFSGPHPTISGDVYRLGGAAEDRIDAIFDGVVRRRLLLGETLFFDNIGNSDHWTSLALQYGYTVYHVLSEDSTPLAQAMSTVMMPDFMTDSQPLARDTTASHNAHSWETQHQDLQQKSQLPQAVHTIIPAEISALLWQPIIDGDCFDRIIVIGDIQSCGTALEIFLDQVQPTAQDAVVFLGDFFDRGIEPVKTWKLVHQLMSYTTTFFVEGNHDSTLFNISQGLIDHPYQSSYETVCQLSEAGISQRQIADFFHKFTPFLPIRRGQNIIWCTHGGILNPGPHEDNCYRTGLYPVIYFVKGASRPEFVRHNVSDYDYDIDRYFHELVPGNIMQCHGHRNRHRNQIAQYPRMFNLESAVEWNGGLLSGVIFDNNAVVRTIQVPNPVTNGYDHGAGPQDFRINLPG